MAIKNGFSDAVNSAAEIHSRMIGKEVTRDAQNARLQAGHEAIGAPEIK